MELIIVLAVIAIIGAILAPNFLSATDRARLKSDVESTNIIQTAINTYNAEQSNPIDVSGSVETVIIPELSGKGYLSASDATTPQTAAAVWTIDTDSIVKLDISGCTLKIKGDIYNALTDKEKAVVTE